MFESFRLGERTRTMNNLPNDNQHRVLPHHRLRVYAIAWRCSFACGMLGFAMRSFGTRHFVRRRWLVSMSPRGGAGDSGRTRRERSRSRVVIPSRLLRRSEIAALLGDARDADAGELPFWQIVSSRC